MRRRICLLLGGVGLACSISLAGCGETVRQGTGGAASDGVGPGPGAGGPGGTVITTPASKVDLLLMIDNSRSMEDKQEILASAVPDLVGRLVNPLCVDAVGQVAGMQPASPLDACPPGSSRELAPVLDIHIGIISSSLGGHGSDTCPDTTTAPCQGTNTSNNDKGHLLARKDPCSPEEVPTYQAKRFLAWDPAGQLAPPGEANQVNFIAALTDMVIGVGQAGCGYEAPLEAWYRFLIDPAPYASISVVNKLAVPAGTDDVLLAQRKDFLRSDSLLAILMLTDEDDCSTVDGGQFYWSNQAKNGDGSEFHLPKPRSACATNPNDPCCRSCGQGPGSGCIDPDPACTEAGLSKIDDNISVRCFDQKRRFGIDFLYPGERYVDGLSKTSIDPDGDGSGAEVPNPIYSDLSQTGAAVRDPGLVFLAGIVGVPWQSIAKDPADLGKGYKRGADVDWAAILGDPANNVPPSDPHMIPSIDPRPGLSLMGTDPIHGHEYTIPDRDDLQYACTFPLPTPRDCSDPQNAIEGCDCVENTTSPVCSPSQPTQQIAAKAYPARRLLGVINAVGPQGVVASICPGNISDPTAPSFGYRPAVASLIEAMSARLPKP